MGFFKSLFGGSDAASPTSSSAPLKSASRSHKTYADLGATAGPCSTCGRATYPIPGPMLVKLTFSEEIDKIDANAMWCLSCDTLVCMGCAHAAGQKCSKCSGALGDVHHRTSR